MTIPQGFHYNPKDPRHKPMKRREEKAAFEAMAQGDKRARERIINANLRFAVTVASRYQHHGLPMADLIAEASLGLLRAVDRFDPCLGYKFITFAVWWIRQAILTALAAQARVYNVPPNLVTYMKRVDAARLKLEQKKFRPPTVAEIAEHMGIKVSRLEEILFLHCDAVSMETQVTEEMDGTLAGVLVDPDASAEDQAKEGMAGRYVRKIMAPLDKREAEIIARNYGLNGGDDQTLEEIGDIIGITRERVRQIKDKAIGRLRREAHILEDLPPAYQAILTGRGAP